MSEKQVRRDSVPLGRSGLPLTRIELAGTLNKEVINLRFPHWREEHGIGTDGGFVGTGIHNPGPVPIELPAIN